MICNNCKMERLVTDFINKQIFCYKCMYQIKKKNVKKKRTPTEMVCRTCGKDFKQDENAKKRKRTIYCSSECAEKGHKKQLKNHWTKVINKKPNV